MLKGLLKKFQIIATGFILDDLVGVEGAIKPHSPDVVFSDKKGTLWDVTFLKGDILIGISHPTEHETVLCRTSQHGGIKGAVKFLLLERERCEDDVPF